VLLNGGLIFFAGVSRPVVGDWAEAFDDQAKRIAIAKADAGWVAVVGADGVLHGYVDEERAVGDGAVADRLHRIETWVPIDSDLQDALATMLLTRVGWVSVLDGDRFAGVLTPESVYQTLRRSLEQPADDGR